MAVSHLALLRGINVGGKNKISMSDLSALFAGAGCMDVRTFIQSGNVIFNASGRMPRRSPAWSPSESRSRSVTRFRWCCVAGSARRRRLE